MPDADLNLMRDVARLMDRVASLEADRQRPYVELRGTGARRVRLGLQDDGTWGLRIWDTAGALVMEEVGS